MRVLVTGSDGLVGSAVVAHLREHGHEIATLHGDARDPAVVAAALPGVDAVAHLAGIADPVNPPPYEIFGNNTLATFTVLWTAAEHGVRRFAVAGSVNATGRLLNPHQPRPPRYPIDESTPPDIADAYSLGKQVDEHTLRAVCRRFDASGVVLRLPLMLSAANAQSLRAWKAGRLAEGVGDGWTWLDLRDGAEAFRLALAAEYNGAHVVLVAAADTLVDVPTDDLLDRYAPDVPRTRSFPGRTAPVDTSRARELLGFSPSIVDERPT